MGVFTKTAGRLAAACAVATLAIGSANAADIAGAGATFPYPAYSSWADIYKKETGTGLNYQAIGSGGGIRQIVAKTVTFGASDAPLKPEQLEQAGLVQWPMIIGGAVPAINLPGVKPGDMKLTGAVVADIYLGNIENWNDKKIADLNPGMKLPATKITPVYRSDGSGTNFLFTNYLSKVSKEFADKVGNAKQVAWPKGTGAKGNAGVAGVVVQVEGSIGYVEYAYVKQNNMTYAALVNKAGKEVHPEISSFQAAAANADWKDAKGYYLVLTDQPGDDSWPITGASFILMHKQVEDAAAAKQALDFFNWAYTSKSAQDAATKLDYVPIPESVVKLVEATWAADLKGPDGKAIWTAK